MKDTPSQPMTEQEFLASYEAHADELFRFSLLKVRNRDQALDVVQETFTRVWNYIRKGKVIENIRPFLFRTARNIIIDESRKHTTVSLEKMQENSYFDAPAPEQPFGVAIDLAQAMDAIDALEPIHREILTLRFINQLDIDEIADTLQLSQNAVSVRIHRGIEALKKQIGHAFDL